MALQNFNPWSLTFDHALFGVSQVAITTNNNDCRVSDHGLQFCWAISGRAIFYTTVKPRFKVPRFNANPDLTRLIPFPQNFYRVFRRYSIRFLRIYNYYIFLYNNYIFLYYYIFCV
jgi:hypothetical protein